MMPNEEHLSDEAREYLSLRRQEEMEKFRKCLVHEWQEEQEAVAEAACLDRERAADLARAEKAHSSLLASATTIALGGVCCDADAEIASAISRER